ncbi:type IV conjugative transfer system protein TraL [Rouxiella silvae]|uniref:Protein TraL n=1 Tax=Rouxiella silvae TaxID=1646373 RepID=A0ABX3TVG3_9GAMM|nr:MULTISPECIES: type IV conjugative transfer system protein TraL [Rouxiella]ORJ19216.1 type IV conjugative transfer system protein TraL [Rouxiella silvae]QOI58091.1 type IV conjugative transfer system protein TraL [Rouxiella badensis subsp. acadiensis]
MSGELDKFKFPETINEQTRIIGLPVDEMFLITTPILAGIGMNMGGQMCIVACLLWLLVRYLKRGKGTYYMVDMLYWYLPSFIFRIFYRVIPDSGNRHWIR